MLDQKQNAKYLRYTPLTLSEYLRERKDRHLFTFKVATAKYLKRNIKEMGREAKLVFLVPNHKQMNTEKPYSSGFFLNQGLAY